jgi:CubicO group peptidase (beta-lactamase class C family)
MTEGNSETEIVATTGRGAHTVRYGLADPTEFGIDPVKLDELRVRAHREIDAGVLPSCQLAVARHGRLVLFETIGDAAPASRYVIFSMTKGVIAGAIWLLVGEGSLHWDDLVVDVIPEFGTNGKDVITVEQLLTHTSGFPSAPLNPVDGITSADRTARFAQWRLNWEPGTRFEYHPTSAHWVLAELIERISGTDYREFVHERIMAPLALTTFRLGEPPDHQGDINDLVAVGEPPTPDELEAATGLRIDIADLLGEVTTEALLSFNQPEVRAVGLPGGGGISTAADIALYYQGVLHNRDKLWDPAVIAAGTEPIVDLPDPIRGMPAHRSRGLMVAGDPPDAQLRGFGFGLSPRTYGHDGAGGQIAWVDPDSGISFCYLTNGLDANILREARRTLGLSSRAGACLAG